MRVSVTEGDACCISLVKSQDIVEVEHLFNRVSDLMLAGPAVPDHSLFNAQWGYSKTGFSRVAAAAIAAPRAAPRIRAVLLFCTKMVCSRATEVTANRSIISLVDLEIQARQSGMEAVAFIFKVALASSLGGDTSMLTTAKPVALRLGSIPKMIPEGRLPTRPGTGAWAFDGGNLPANFMAHKSRVDGFGI